MKKLDLLMLTGIAAFGLGSLTSHDNDTSIATSNYFDVGNNDTNADKKHFNRVNFASILSSWNNRNFSTTAFDEISSFQNLVSTDFNNIMSSDVFHFETEKDKSYQMPLLDNTYRLIYDDHIYSFNEERHWDSMLALENDSSLDALKGWYLRGFENIKNDLNDLSESNLSSWNIKNTHDLKREIVEDIVFKIADDTSFLSYLENEQITEDNLSNTLLEKIANNNVESDNDLTMVNFYRWGILDSNLSIPKWRDFSYRWNQIPTYESSTNIEDDEAYNTNEAFKTLFDN